MFDGGSAISEAKWFFEDGNIIFVFYLVLALFWVYFWEFYKCVSFFVIYLRYAEYNLLNLFADGLRIYFYCSLL